MAGRHGLRDGLRGRIMDGEHLEQVEEMWLLTSLTTARSLLESPETTIKERKSSSFKISATSSTGSVSSLRDIAAGVCLSSSRARFMWLELKINLILIKELCL